MWTAHAEKIDAQTIRTTLRDATGELSFRAVIDLWRESEEFRKYFTSLLTDAPFEAYFFETPPVTDSNSERPFEYVLIQSAQLSGVRSDRAAFAEHFSSHPSEAVLTFPNLGGDALLIVPSPVSEETNYTHLARFLRNAPHTQADAFWRATGLAMRQRISRAPVWLSTAGLGVSWLHLRLDSRPKYYRHAPYKQFS